MQIRTPGSRDYRFVLGLVAGTVVGAGLTMWLTPRSASELRQRVAATAGALRQRGVDEYRRVRARAGEAADGVSRRGQALRDDVAGAVARAAHEVERQATAVRTKSVADGRSSATAEDEAAAADVSDRQPAT